MGILYATVSFVVAIVLIKVSRIIGNLDRKGAAVLVYLIVVVLTALVHYRIFLYNDIFGVVLEDGLMIDLLSLFWFLFTCIVPATTLRKKLH